MRSKAFAIVLSLTAIAAAAAAEARPIRVLEIRHARSFLNSGTVAPVGSQELYITQSTTLNQPIYSTSAPDSFGADVLPGRFGGIGR